MQPVRQTPGGQDVLGRLLADLCTRLPTLEDDGAAALREYVEEEARDLQGEAFTRFMDTLFERISALVARSEVADNLGAVRAIDQLIGVQLGENATKISRFANYLRQIFEEKGDPAVMVAASVALGHLAREGGALTADVVEFQVKRALEWLQGERVESKRFAAVLILKEMAENAPTVFNVHIPVFIDAIWSAMRDPKLEVRLRAVDALRACLCVIEKRETRWRVQGYYRMFEETQKGLNKTASVESIHGSLLAIGELLRNTGEFMMARYKEVAKIVLNYRDHRERLVRRSITALLPRIAYFLRDRFVASYLKVCMEHLLGVMRNPAERTTGFAALGEMAGAVGPALTPYLPSITPLLREAIAPSRRGRPCPEALACVGQLAQAVGPDYTEHARSLLEPLFQGGLSPILVESLAQIASSLPVLLPSIQERLLDVLSLILAKKPYRPPSAASPLARSPSLGSPVLQSELTAAGLTQLALRTLATFDLNGHDMIEFVREHVVRYLDDDEVHTRREAAVTCCRLLKASVAGAGLRLPRDGRPLGSRRKRVLVEEVLERLLVAAVADADEGVRRAVLLSLPEGAGFEENLAQADSLRAVFIALNDESFEVRQYAITLAGQLAERNPAYVLPALRRHLLQLLTDLEHSSDSKHKQESARLLGCLVHACPRLILPYIAPVLKALVAQLRESSTGGAATGETSSGGGRSGVITNVLATVGELARVGGGTMRPYVGELMPLVVDALHDGGTGSDSKRRQVAVCTLGQLVESTGYVVVPYTDFPQLLGVLLRLLNGEHAWAMRHEVLKVLGVIGALDPHAHKRNQMLLQAGHAEGGRPAAPADGGMARSALVEADLPGEVLPSSGMSTSSEEYYPTVAINALMRILREKAMSSYHQRVVGSLMYIFRAMGLACVPYLPKVLPDLFHVMTVCDDALRDFLLRQLAQLVAIVRQHIRKYLPELLNLIHEYWSYPALLLPVLHLVEQLSRALNDEFRAHLPEILPRCVQVLALAEQTGDYASVPPVLHAFEVFGSSMDEHMHLVLPALVRLLKPSVVDAPVDIRRATIRTLGRLLPTMHVAGHASAILHPLTRVLDGPQEELRKDAMDAICALAGAMGSDFAIFIPSIRKLLHKHRLTHPRFEGVAARVLRREPAVVLEASSLMHAPSDASSLSEVYHGARQADGESVDGEDDAAMAPGRVLRVNEGALRRAWESSQRSTREDWAEWMRHFSVELLKESPSPALRTCAGLAQLQPHVARELFAAGFVSCWSELSPNYREQLVRSLEAAFASPTIPPEILATLLNLAEFMEHDEKPLPMEIRTLGALAEKCHAFAKALHYKEREFETSPTTTVEALIHINNQLHQHEAAVGILHYAQQQQGVELKESWYEELQRWDEALEAYELKAAQAQTHHQALEATLGRMRCLAALARWDELGSLCRETWAPAEPAARLEMAPMAASAAWNLNEWDEMHEYVSVLDDGDDAHRRMPMNAVGGSRGGSVGSGISDGPFFRAVLSVRRGQYADARMYVERARKLLATELAALVLESYERAYGNMVRVQQLAELEEVIDYCQLPTADAAADARAALIRRMWQDRVRGAQRNVEVWQALLAVRSLVLPPSQDIATWLKFASLCRKSGRVSQSQATLVKLLQYDPAQEGGGRLSVEPPVMLAYLKHQWSLGGDRNRMDAFHQMQELAGELEHSAAVVSGAAGPQSLSASALMSGDAGILVGGVPILARIYLKLGTWRWTLSASLDDDAISGILSSLAAATESARGWAKAWHKWALFNTAVMSHHTVMHNPAAAARHVVAAVNGYFRSIALGSANQKGGDGSLQDILRLLTLWFNHGAATDVQAALQEGFQQLNIDTWLVVIPQIIARIHSPVPAVRNLIQALLTRVGRHHPQALMYPLLVACKSMSSSRKQAAQAVVDNVRNHSATLVKQAQLVSKELIRMAILWHEMWHEALEEASRLYFGEHNVEGMLQALEPLHAMMDKQGAETLKEISFGQAYGRELQEAHECCMRFRRTGKEAEITQAWDLYYNVFKRINKQLPSLTTLELQYVSPALVQARNLELAVPGTYRAGAPVVTIASFAAQLTVITSKQRPRKCTIYGSDGVEYTFLLKGHEDLRQDERVMQLFGLVNTLLANARQSAELDLAIQRYSVIPLSPNSGLIGWVPNCDTLHQLIREYRDQRKVPVNHEHRLMLQFAPDYDALPLMAKVEVFEHALDNTSGNDLNKVLWLKSRSSEVWLDRRTNYTRSLAVMSMVGYLLGLGDRHPSNLMLDRYSGKIIHIDFGDCFEASMNREKFPERVPFRLTRMLVKAMEVSGIEGNFRSTCENVMTVLRQNKDSVMAMMEAFVHDPLINWRLFHLADGSTHPTGARGAQPAQPADEQAAPPSPPQRGAREKELREAVGQLGDANEVLNERAVAVMTRMSNKLTGRDFGVNGVPPIGAAGVPGAAGAASSYLLASSGIGAPGAEREEPGLTVKVQVQKLIAQAMSHENLCQSYIGWCPFW